MTMNRSAATPTRRRTGPGAERRALEDKLATGLQQLQDYRAGNRSAAREHRVLPGPVDVAAIRQRLGLSQSEFARHYGFSLGTLKNWEQQRRAPDGPARTLLLLIDAMPEAVEQVLQQRRGDPAAG